MMQTACRGDRHNLRVGFTLPSMVATLYRVDRTVIDLTGATDVHFKMRRQAKDVPLKVDRTVAVVDADGGIVRVDWLAGDVDTVARYDGWFVVTFTDGNTLPVPNPGFITVVVGHA